MCCFFNFYKHNKYSKPYQSFHLIKFSYFSNFKSNTKYWTWQNFNSALPESLVVQSWVVSVSNWGSFCTVARPLISMETAVAVQMLIRDGHHFVFDHLPWTEKCGFYKVPVRLLCNESKLCTVCRQPVMINGTVQQIVEPNRQS